MDPGQPESPPGGRHGLVAVIKFCPFDCCSQHIKAEKPTGFSSKTNLKDHLADVHKDELYKLSDDKLKESGLYVCRQCGDYVAASESVFLRHITSKHVKTRKTTNHKIVTNLLYSLVESVHTNHWEEGLAWLRTFTPEEPNFRQSLILKIKHELEDDVTDCFEDILNACVECAKKPTDDRYNNTEEYNPEPIWILPFIFEQLVLCPNPDPPKPGHKGTSLRKCITRRLRLFRSGQLELLHREAQMITSKSARSFRESPPSSLKCAQEAADNDNFKSAYARIVKHMPIAPIGPENENILRALFPKSLNIGREGDESDSEMGDATSSEGGAPPPGDNRRGHSQHGVTTRAATIAELTKNRVTIAPGDMTKTLGNLRRGRAPGVQVDSLDIFIKLQRRRAMEN